MKASELISESSGYSLEGSWTNDLVLSKLWLARELKKILGDQSIPVAYILGSWYGNLAIILRRAHVPIDQIINVEKNPQWLSTGQKISRAMGLDHITIMAADANDIDYRRLEDPGLVINTSTNDIADKGWFDAIPDGTLVAIQGRNQVLPGAEHTYETADDLLELYPLEKVLYKGTFVLEDPETRYKRHMIIGIKGKRSLSELQFLGSQCTKDCSGHRAGYEWHKRNGRMPASWSPSFNKGAALSAAGL